MTGDREIMLKVGRGSQQGDVRLSAQTPSVLTLSVSYQGERAATVVLTGEQLRELQRALAELEPLVEAQPAERVESLKLAA